MSIHWVVGQPLPPRWSDLRAHDDTRRHRQPCPESRGAEPPRRFYFLYRRIPNRSPGPAQMANNRCCLGLLDSVAACGGEQNKGGNPVWRRGVGCEQPTTALLVHRRRSAIASPCYYIIFVLANGGNNKYLQGSFSGPATPASTEPQADTVTEQWAGHPQHSSDRTAPPVIISLVLLLCTTTTTTYYNLYYYLVLLAIVYPLLAPSCSASFRSFSSSQSSPFR